MGLPAIVAGALVTRGGVLLTAREYGIFVITLAGLALVGTLVASPVAAAPAMPVLADSADICPLGGTPTR
jgi:hypothetical protein